MKKRNFKIQRRIYRFVMWTSAIGAGWIIYREDLWWTLAVLVLYSWFRAGAQSVKGAYLNEITELKKEQANNQLSDRQWAAIFAIADSKKGIGVYSQICQLQIGLSVFYSLVKLKIAEEKDQYFILTEYGKKINYEKAV